MPRAFLSAALVLMAAASAAPAQEPMGPLALRNHHPLYVGLLYPPPEAALPARRPSFDLALNHTSVFVRLSSPDYAAAVDKELSELTLTARAPVWGGRAEVAVDAPFYYSSPGSFDGFVRWWHRSIGAPSYAGQVETPDNEFSDIIYYQGAVIAEGEREKFAPGDITLSLKAVAARIEGAALTVQALAQAPTGEARKGTGSGRWEYGARGLLMVTDGPVTLHAGLGAVAHGSVERIGESIAYDSTVSGFAAAEWLAWPDFSLVVQSMFNTSPLPDARFTTFSKEWMDVAFGAKWRVNENFMVALGMSENLTQTAPDFTLHCAVTFMPGGEVP